jgi:hypothetical protein|uniref:Secreted protein n=1 Tax=Lactococcus lactis TaxID=1358 RepID=L0N3Z5_9LACT|nr:hypothetical protein [Lactococcus lactis]
MKSKVLLGSLLTSLTLLSAGAPLASVVSADQKTPTSSAGVADASAIKPIVQDNSAGTGLLTSDDIEVIYIDNQGVEHPYNPNAPTPRFSTGVISIGLKFKYTSKSDGQQLKSALTKCKGAKTAAYICQVLGWGTASIVGIAVTQMVAGGINVFVNRCSESISAINSHPSKGAVYMYIDHVTWKAS